MGPFINDVAPYSCSACWTHFHALAGDGPRAQCGTDTYRLSHMAASIFPEPQRSPALDTPKNSKSGRRGPGVLTARTHLDAQADEGSVVVQTGAKCRHATSLSPTLSPHAAARLQRRAGRPCGPHGGSSPPYFGHAPGRREGFPARIRCP